MRAAYALAILSWMAAALAQRPPMSTDFDLRGRHPEVYEETLFAQWLGTAVVGEWEESISLEGKPQLSIQSADKSTIYVGEIGIINSKKVIERPEILDLRQYRDFREKSLGEVLHEFPNARIISIVPKVLRTTTGSEFAWRIEALNQKIEALWFSKRVGLSAISTVSITVPPAGPPIVACNSAVDDTLSADDLHHPALFKQETEDLVIDLAADDIMGRARRIMEFVNLHHYNANNAAASYAFADIIIPTAGEVCDEYATLMISRLRAIGIHSEMKYLLIKRINGTQEAHAVVEFFDGTVAHHADPCLSIFDDRAHYRNDPATSRDADSVLVFDTAFPDDRRSITTGDPSTTDFILDQYDDFCLNPANWDSRPGYSHP